MAERAVPASKGDRRLVERAGDVVCALDSGATFVSIDGPAEAIFGRGVAELLGMKLLSLVHPDDVGQVAAMLQSARQGTTTPLFYVRIFASSGDHLLLEGMLSPRVEEGRTIGALGIFRDVAGREELRQEFEDKEKRYRALFDALPEIAFSLAPDTARIATLNPAFTRVLGHPVDDWLGARFDDLVDRQDRALAAETLARAVDRGGPQLCEIRLRAASGPPRVFETSLAAEVGAGTVAAVHGVARDVTARRELEAQLRQAQKMQSIGTLAGGVAHDFNNLITGIVAFTDLAAMGLSPDDARLRHVHGIRKLADRAATLTRQLLGFARKQVLVRKSVDLGRVVAEFSKLLERTLGETIRVELDLAPSLPPVEADVGQIEQVIMNLCLNARDAMPRGGSLTLRTTEVRFDDARDVPAGAPPGHYALLAVRDTGSGMDAATRARIFEPFFTTKEQGHGFGLGLAMVYGIVEQHGGVIRCESEVGRGSEFRIYLPVATAAAVHAPAPPVETGPGRGETVLVVEDEGTLRGLVCQILATAGYRVIAAAGAEDAVRSFSADPAAVDLVLADVVMPGSGGQELHAELTARRPDVRFLFMTGHAIGSEFVGFAREAGVPVLEKPFGFRELTRSVREVLDRP
jgi:PAS domain S-box-containing protein